MQDLFSIVLASLDSIGRVSGYQHHRAIQKVLEALHGLLARDEAREQKHVQHVGGETGLNGP